MHTKTAVHSLFATLIIGGAAPTLAQNTLYDAPPPEDAAFVRFIGLSEAEITWNGLVFPTGESGADYHVVHSDRVSATAGDFLTVISDTTTGELKPILEDPYGDTQITLSLINLTSSLASLKLADGSLSVVENVASGDIGSRQVNPLSVSFAVFVDGETYGPEFPVVLRRGEHPTFVAYPDGVVESIISNVLPGIIE